MSIKFKNVVLFIKIIQNKQFQAQEVISSHVLNAVCATD